MLNTPDSFNVVASFNNPILFSPTAASHVHIAFHPVLTLVFCSKNCSQELPQFSSWKQEVLIHLEGMREQFRAFQV